MCMRACVPVLYTCCRCCRCVAGASRASPVVHRRRVRRYREEVEAVWGRTCRCRGWWFVASRGAGPAGRRSLCKEGERREGRRCAEEEEAADEHDRAHAHVAETYAVSISACIEECAHACVRVCVCASVRVGARRCVGARVRHQRAVLVRVRACMRVCARCTYVVLNRVVLLVTGLHVVMSERMGLCGSVVARSIDRSIESIECRSFLATIVHKPRVCTS
jgi:hypothetical protein